jgi:hypothetical protein
MASQGYSEGIMFPEGYPIPIGHAMYKDQDGIYNDITHDEPNDVFYMLDYDSADFRKHMSNPDFVKEFEKHTMFPYTRALVKFNKL